MECENTYNPPFSRVRVRAYIQEFLFFCCHKCHRFIYKCLEHRLLSYFFECFLTVNVYPQNPSAAPLKNAIFLLPFCCTPHLIFPHLSFRTSPPCDTCDSKKTQLRLERARLRVRAKNSTAFCSASSLFNLNLNALHFIS